MGMKSRRKGYRIEAECVTLLQDAGIAAVRVPLSGGAGGKYAGDISAPVLGIDRTLEVKCRASGFATLYRWLKPVYGLVLRADHEEPLIVLRLKDFATLAIQSDRSRLSYGQGTSVFIPRKVREVS